jgi:hypothetical protein
MKARLKLKPGLKGTKGLVDVYGDALICVRYRYDAASCTRIKTVEIIVDKKPWTSPLARFADEELVPVRIRFSESTLKELAKSVGGKWNPEKSSGLFHLGRSRVHYLKSI